MRLLAGSAVDAVADRVCIVLAAKRAVRPAPGASEMSVMRSGLSKAIDSVSVSKNEPSYSARNSAVRFDHSTLASISLLRVSMGAGISFWDVKPKLPAKG